MPSGAINNLAGFFREVAGVFPANVALISGSERITYGQLDLWSDRISWTLRRRGAGPGGRVALRMPPCAPAVASVLGILKAGAAYVPLDVNDPTSRGEFVLADSGAKVLVGEPGQTTLTCEVITAAQIEQLRHQPPDGAHEMDEPGPRDAAHIIYTSGTTGRPKGVVVSHGSVVSLLDAAATVFDFTSDDRWLLFHSLAFDFSVWEMWGAFSAGGALVVLPYWTARNPRDCLSLITEQRVTVLNQTPTAFVGIAGAALQHPSDITSLRYVIFGGEKLTSAALHPWAEKFGLDRPRLVNGYGITETTVFSTFHFLCEEDLTSDVSVIGRPLPGFGTRIVDADGKDVPPGVEGELWLSGPQVSDGYVNRPELTHERFPEVRYGGNSVVHYRSGDLVAGLPNGELAYRGRADLQVKMRGYRIELSDVESVARTHDQVADAVVWVREFKPGDSRLVCAVLSADGAGVDVEALRAHVDARLPPYMRPSRYRSLPVFPPTPNGKTDRAAVARLWEERNRTPWKNTPV
ncbi:amino acid adenylation domain-containing protein [Streptomyces niveus]